MAITLKEIAELAHVSRGAIDKVIHNRPGVSEETRAKVNEILEKYNYVPSKAGKLLASHKKDVCIGVISIINENNDYFYTVKKGMDMAYEELKQYSFFIKHVIVEKNEEEILIHVMKELVAENVKAIVLPPYNSKRTAEYIDELYQQGIVVVTYSTDVASEKRLFFVGNDYYQSGVIAASLIGKLLGNEGSIAVFRGDLGIKCHDDRLLGFTTYLSEQYQGIQVIENVEICRNELASYFATRSILQKNPRLNGIFIVSRGVEGVVSAIKESALETRPKIVMFDIFRDTLKYLASGDVDFVVDQNPLEQGRIIINTLFDYFFFRKKIENTNIYTNFSIYVKESIIGQQLSE